MDHTKVEVTDKFEIINVDVLVIIVVFGTFMNLQHLNRLEVFTIWIKIPKLKHMSKDTNIGKC